LALVQRETAPFYVFDFLERIYELLVDYLSKVTPSSLKAQFTVVYQVSYRHHRVGCIAVCYVYVAC
jgi:hypothetical protein